MLPFECLKRLKFCRSKSQKNIIGQSYFDRFHDTSILF
jgi:hypothetical protein